MLRLLVLAALLLPAVAHADDGVATFALIVGSNAGGPGQTDLHYAEDDARRVAETLIELGGYAAGAVDILEHPTPDQVREHLSQLAAKVTTEIAAGRQVRVMFYYSGHARATAIDLGKDQLPLDELRQRLFAVPATLTVVVLDACQSGAFSQVRGAAAAADFSVSSRQHLDATGVAVLASSTGSELSQESKELKAGYFTHHLLVGLRGAGDLDRDGQVSIDEAYRYAYHQTLLSTAETAVGGQHVVLQVDLKGHGQIPLSYPRVATAAIELPSAIEGKALVEDTRAHAVVAELFKAKGAPVRIAVAPGDYQVVVRGGDTIWHCAIATQAIATVDLTRCTSEPLRVEVYKGAPPPGKPLQLEVIGSIGDERHDGYTDTLKNFGYYDSGGTASQLKLQATWQVDRRLWVGGMVSTSSAPSWSMSVVGGQNRSLGFDWNLETIGGVARALQPFGETGGWARSGVFAQVGARLGIARTHFTDQDNTSTTDTFFGWATSFAAGLHFDGNRGIGFSLGYEFEYAPVIENKTGDTHASGGHRIFLGVSYAR